MSSPQPRKRSMLLLGAAAASLALVAVVLFVLLRGSPVDKLRDLYNTQAAASRAATWTRPDPPPGAWTLLDGAAPDDYQLAWELLDKLGPEPVGFKALLQRLAPDAEAPPPTPDTALDPACAALGVTPELHSRLPELRGPLCDRLQAAQPALQLVETASRRRDSSSPLRVTDPWSQPNAQRQHRSLIPFIALGRLLVLQATLDRPQGREERADAWLTALLRFSGDLERGGDLVSAVLGSALRHMVAAALHEAARRGELSDRSLERLSEALRWELEHRPDAMPSILRDDFLLSTPLLLASDELEGFDLVTPYDSASALGGNGGPLERFWRRDALRTYHQVWTEQLALEPSTCEARFALSDRHEQQMTQSLNPLTQILAGNPMKLYEARILLSWSQLALLLTALSDLRYQRAHGKPAPDADALRDARLPAPQDPLTQRPLRWTQDGDARTLHLDLPPALEPTFTSHDMLKKHLRLTLL